jgi:ACS family glucarate transporter-like MFS transporter
MADFYGPAKMLAVVMLWYGLFTSETAWTPSGVPFALGLLLCVRFLLCSGEACMFSILKPYR